MKFHVPDGKQIHFTAQIKGWEKGDEYRMYEENLFQTLPNLYKAT